MSKRRAILLCSLCLLFCLCRTYPLSAARAESVDATPKGIQQRLIDLGYLTGDADGMWGQRSMDAWHAFQALNGLSETNRPDDATLEALFSGDAMALPEGLDIGDQGERVEALQRTLIRYGFLSGDADGAYGKQTAAAVTRLQQHLLAQGCPLVANGVATPLTFYYLEKNGVIHLRDVALNAGGGEARRVETRLCTLGYMDATADASFDRYAVEALRQFQAQAGLAVTGEADRQTFDALFSPDAPATDRCVPHGIASGDRGQIVRRVEEALFASGMSAKLPNGRYNAEDEEAVINLYRYFKGDPAMVELFSNRYGLSRTAVETLLAGIGPGTGDVSRANEALRVQRRLFTLYYLHKGDIDGTFGEDSRAALREFQATNGLPETGEADPATLARLYAPDAAAKRLPYRVEVSLSDQAVTVHALNDAGDYDVVRSFHCSTGLHNSTPRGIFLDGFPANRWHYFKKFDCWAQYSFDIEGDIMFHSVLYSDKDESTLRTNSVNALGNPASHGCIRLTVEDAQWLFEHCPKGSLAIVID